MGCIALANKSISPSNGLDKLERASEGLAGRKSVKHPVKQNKKFSQDICQFSSRWEKKHSFCVKAIPSLS
jgi:hypothetical protein